MSRRILIINTIGLSYEGISSVIYNYISNMNRENLDIEFVGFETTKPEILNKFGMFGKIHILPDRQQQVISYLVELKKLLAQGFDAVHIHGNSGTMAADVFCARAANVRQIIVHGHSTKCDHKIIHKTMRLPMMLMATDCLACSDGVGKWLYGLYPYRVMNNAIRLEQYVFNPGSRYRLRRELGVEDAFLIGHVGHFTEPKNHPFLLAVFAAYHQLDANASLLLVGDGPNRKTIEAQIAELELEDAVIMTGRRSDVCELYSAMDLLVMPSKWEGLPVSLLEAQTNALPILASDVITKDVACTPLVNYLSLTETAESWARNIHIIRSAPHNREMDHTEALRERGFDIHQEAELLRRMYLRD